MSLTGGGSVYRPNDDNSKFLIYISKEVSCDSQFPLSSSTLLKVQFNKNQVILTSGDK